MLLAVDVGNTQTIIGMYADRSHELLDVLLEVERTLGRERRERWGPRTIDLDPELVVPGRGPVSALLAALD